MTKEIKHDYIVPDGWKVVCIGLPKKDDYVIRDGEPYKLKHNAYLSVTAIIEKNKPEPEDTLRFRLDWDCGYPRFLSKPPVEHWIYPANSNCNGFVLNNTRYAFSHYEKDGEYFGVAKPSYSGDINLSLQRADTIVFKHFELEESDK